MNDFLFTDFMNGEEQLNIQNRKCIKCHRILPISFFPIMVHHRKSTNPILRAHCKDCDDKLNNERKTLKKKYGNPPDDYKCPICGRTKSQLREQTRFKSIWTIDHDHITGEFRGWLCHPCNRGIGMLGDNPQILQSAIEYLLNRQGCP